MYQKPVAKLQSNAPIAEVRDMTKAFGDKVVFQDFSLSFQQKETTVVLGPSGTGKSVLIRQLNGLMKPDKGEVWCCGHRVEKYTERQWMPLRQQVGYLFQLGALFDSMTVGQNVAFPLREHTDFSLKECEEIVAYALELVGLAGLSQQYPSMLSGGQQRRVAMARAVILRPEMILYDEPTTGLDPLTGALISELIAALDSELGISGIVVTHDMACAKRVGERYVLLNQGHIIADASAKEFLELDHPYVKRFITGSASQEELSPIRTAFTSAN